MSWLTPSTFACMMVLADDTTVAVSFVASAVVCRFTALTALSHAAVVCRFTVCVICVAQEAAARVRRGGEGAGGGSGGGGGRGAAAAAAAEFGARARASAVCLPIISCTSASALVARAASSARFFSLSDTCQGAKEGVSVQRESSGARRAEEKAEKR